MLKSRGMILKLALGALLSTTALASAQDLAALEKAAKAEGMLTTIALPHDWCGYGDVIDGFKAKYPDITVNELNPDAGSGDEIEAIKANKDNKGPQAPDVIDVGLVLRPVGQGRRPDPALQGRRPGTRSRTSAKDADGYWYGDYYGVLSFEVNKDLVKNVPQRLGRPAEARIHELGRARRRSARLEPGDPGRLCRRPRRRRRRAGAAAGEAGLEFFAELNKAGNFVPVIGKAAHARAGRDADHHRAGTTTRSPAATRSNGNPPVEVVVPKTGVVAGVYVQAISAYAPHPNAAKLWMEYLYSDEGPARLAQGLLPPDPLQRPRQERQDPGRTCSTSCRRRTPTRRPCSRRSTSRRAAKEAITKKLGHASSAPTSSKSERIAAAAGIRGRPASLRDRAARMTDISRRPSPAAADRSRRRRPRRAACALPIALARRRAVLPLRAAVPDPADAVLIVLGAFQDADGRLHARTTSRTCSSPRSSRPTGSRIKISVASALLGCARSASAIAVAVVLRRPAAAGSAPPLLTFSGVASNFAGVPLAFAFLATLGPARPGDRAAATTGSASTSTRLGFNLLSASGA